jgi:hypothetical protein
MSGWAMWLELRQDKGGVSAVSVDGGAVPADPPVHSLVPVGVISTFAGDYLRQGFRVVVRVTDDWGSADVWAWKG